MGFLTLFASATFIAALAPSAAVANGGLAEGANPLTAWNITPLITLGTVLTAWAYFTGIRRWRRIGLRVGAWKQTSFYVGLAVIYLALQSPTDALAEHLFILHQIVHMMIRVLGPLLLVLSVPQAPILKGFPGWARDRVAKPVIRDPRARGLYRFFSDPFVATAVFVGLLYFWQVPVLHNAAVLNEVPHQVMHATMILSGLFFWWLIVDPRDAVSRVTYGVRLLMLAFALITNIPLGAFITFKGETLYNAYDAAGRLWGISALSDERQGGLILWIPGSMGYVVGALIVLRLLYVHENKEEEKRLGRLDPPGQLQVKPAGG